MLLGSCLCVPLREITVWRLPAPRIVRRIVGAVVTVAVIRELDLRALVVEGFRRYTEIGAIFVSFGV